MNTLNDLVSEAISDFGNVAALARAPFTTDAICVEIILTSPSFCTTASERVYISTIRWRFPVDSMPIKTGPANPR
jgi:hypothetical protein